MLARSRTPSLVLSVLVLCLFADTKTASAQETTIRLGLGSSSMSFEGDDDRETGVRRRAGVVAGVSFMPRGGDRGGLQFEVLVVQKGADNLLRRDDRIRFTYIEIPVLMHMDFWQQGNSSAYFVVGPSVAFNVKASYTDEDGATEDIRPDITRVDVGFNLGIGIELGRFVLDARSTWGLRSAFKADDVDFRQRTLALTAGVRFR